MGWRVGGLRLMGRFLIREGVVCLALFSFSTVLVEGIRV